LEGLSDKGKKKVRTKFFCFLKEKQKKFPKIYYTIFYQGVNINEGITIGGSA
jgi:hypothetical protein